MKTDRYAIGIDMTQHSEPMASFICVECKTTLHQIRDYSQYHNFTAPYLALQQHEEMWHTDKPVN